MPRPIVYGQREAVAPALAPQARLCRDEGFRPQGGRLSASLILLAEEAQRGRLSLAAVSLHLQGATPFLMCALLSLPFCQPVPLVGMSTPFGLAILCLAAGAFLSDRVRLPARLGRVQIPKQVFPAVLKASSWLVSRAERILRPRLTSWIGWPWRLVWAALMAVSAILLMLPIPVPLSNSFPAVTILCLALGMLEEDGLAVVAGLGLFVATLVFDACLFLLGSQMWSALLA